MKRNFLFILVLCIMSGVVSAQGFYIRVGGTYGLPAGTANIGQKQLHTYSSTSNPTDTYSTKSVSASYGAGPAFAIAGGYKFNQNFIFELNAQYLISNKFQTSNIYNETGSFTGSESDVFSNQANGLFLNPSFIFSAGFGKAAPYGRFGVVVGSPTLTNTESYYYNLDGTSTRDITWVYKKGLALGYQAAIGMNWKLTEKLDIYTEVNFLSMSWYAQQGEMTKNVQNGSDILGQLSVSQKQISFEKSYDPTLPNDGTKPLVQGRESTPFSSVSAQVGIRFTLFQKKDE